MSEFLRTFSHSFSQLNKDNLAPIKELYTDDILFRDPLHEVRGIAALEKYFLTLYSNVSNLRVEVYACDEIGKGEGYLRWTMRYEHPRLNSGRLIRIEGCSHLLWDTRVYQHHDYFDAGALLYEHLPLMGSAIRWLKRRLA